MALRRILPKEIEEMPGIDPTLLARVCLGLALSVAIVLAICELFAPRNTKEPAE